MTATDYFMLLGAIYISHETRPSIRTSVGLLSIVIGAGFAMFGVKP